MLRLRNFLSKIIFVVYLQALSCISAAYAHILGMFSYKYFSKCNLMLNEKYLHKDRAN